jgi:hypothetical protein
VVEQAVALEAEQQVVEQAVALEAEQQVVVQVPVQLAMAPNAVEHQTALCLKNLHQG